MVSEIFLVVGATVSPAFFAGGSVVSATLALAGGNVVSATTFFFGARLQRRPLVVFLQTTALVPVPAFAPTFLHTVPDFGVVAPDAEVAPTTLRAPATVRAVMVRKSLDELRSEVMGRKPAAKPLVFRVQRSWFRQFRVYSEGS